MQIFSSANSADNINNANQGVGADSVYQRTGATRLSLLTAYCL